MRVSGGDLTFVFLSTTDWDAPQFGSRQQIALRLGRRGHRVLFVEVPRALHSYLTDPAGMSRARGRMGTARAVAEGVWAYTPRPVLPLYYNPATNAVNQRLLRRDLTRALADRGWRPGRGANPDVVWTYWPNTAHLLAGLGARAAVYHCIDDFVAVGYPLTPRRLIAGMEARQLRRADLVLTRTEGLAARARRHNDAVHVLPGGVDADAYGPHVVPNADLMALPAPRVGLVGTLDDRVDVELLAHCARRLPEVSLVLVGPVKGHRVDLEPLRALPNVRFYPACPSEAVPSYVAALDVCLIPYRVNPYTRGLSPLKLYEYLAQGRPVVASDLPYVRREAGQIRLATDPDAWVAAIREALDHPPDDDARAAWRAVAEHHSWDGQVDRIERLLAPILGGAP